MILVDANVLVYAYVPSMPLHDAAYEWVEGSLAGRVRLGLPWPSLLAFVRLVTNPRVFSAPTTIPAAWEQVRSWLAAAPAFVPVAGPDHQMHLEECLQVRGLGANDVPDAHLAALAREHGLKIATTDAGFARFPGLQWFDPTER